MQVKGADRWYLGRGTAEIHEEFKSIAGVCAVALGFPNTDVAWAGWLDCLRRASNDFKAGELRLDSRPTELRPEPDFEVVARGLLYEPFEVRPDPDPDPDLHSIEMWDVDDVCAASERLCGRAADEMLKTEIAASAHERDTTRPSKSGNRTQHSGWTITQPWEAEFVPPGVIPRFPQSVPSSDDVGTSRRRVVEPRLSARGWSILDWAKEAKVDYNTAHNYLNGSTTPRRDTIKKLAIALGIDSAELPV